MVRNALKQLVKSVRSFLAALSHTKKQPPPPDPRWAAAQKMRESMHASRVATSGMSSPEPFYAKELSKGYEQER